MCRQLGLPATGECVIILHAHLHYEQFTPLSLATAVGEI